jgi:hypothetical protein
MKKIIRLTEGDLTRLVKRSINEIEMMDVSSDSEYYSSRKNKIEIDKDEVARMYQLAKKFCRDKDNLPDCKEIEYIAREYRLNF